MKIKELPVLSRAEGFIPLTLQQARGLLNCRPNTLRNWDNKGILKAIRFGRRGDRRYRKSEIFKTLKGDLWH